MKNSGPGPKSCFEKSKFSKVNLYFFCCIGYMEKTIRIDDAFEICVAFEISTFELLKLYWSWSRLEIRWTVKTDPNKGGEIHFLECTESIPDVLFITCSQISDFVIIMTSKLANYLKEVPKLYILEIVPRCCLEFL